MIIAKNKSMLTKKILTYFQNREILKKSLPVAIFSLALVILAFQVKDGKIFLQSIPILTIGILALPIYILTTKILLNKSNKNFKEAQVEFIFETNLINIIEKNQKEKPLHYSSIVKFKNTKKYILLFLSKNAAMIVDKSGFYEGSQEKVLKILELKITEKNETLKTLKS